MPPGSEDDDLTLWLRRMSAGEASAADRVAAIVYQELRRLASIAIGYDHQALSLEPTLLVNEAFLRLIKSKPVDWQDRKHFYALASRMMRRVLIDYFRARSACKRPPGELRLSLEHAVIFSVERQDEALIVDEALNRLHDVDSRAAQVVEMRYFGGFTVEQIAETLGVVEKTVKRDWEMARWWLRRYFEIEDRAAAAPV